MEIVLGSQMKVGGAFNPSCGFAGCVVALFMLLSPCALAESGAYEAAMKAGFLQMLRSTYGDAAFSNEAAEVAAEEAGSCLAAYVVDGFMPDELQQLDASASGGPFPSAKVTERALSRLVDLKAAKLCIRSE